MSEIIAHGYSVRDVTSMSARCAYRFHARHGILYGEAKVICADAMIERILTSATRPTPVELSRAALRDMHVEYRARLRLEGKDEHFGRRATSGEYIRGFAKLAASDRLASPFEDAVIEPIALRQIMAALKPTHRLVLLDQAAGRHVSHTLLSVARLEARALWNFPDPPGHHYRRHRVQAKEAA